MTRRVAGQVAAAVPMVVVARVAAAGRHLAAAQAAYR
jgi:hypothetical protein